MSQTDIEDQLTDIGDALRREPSVRREVMRRVVEQAMTSTQPPRRRGVFRRGLAVAACVALAAVLWAAFAGSHGNGRPGPGEAFAAAIDSVRQARTFAARAVHEGEEDGKPYVRETAVMFKEPDLERMERRQGWPMDGETMITDYTARRRLILFPDDQVANVQDISTMYSVQEGTGELEPTKLSTRHRDDVMRLSAMAVKDLGRQALDGREVRVLRSDDGKQPVKTVWVDLRSGKPVQIELAWPGGTYTYADIRIDEALDDALFSFDLPKGYKLESEFKGTPPTRPSDPAMNGKVFAKVMHVIRTCYEYQSKHDKFPDELDDLAKSGTVTAAALRTALAAPGDADGPPVLVYRKPRAGKDGDSEVVLYEAPEHRRDGKVIVGFWDGHAELVDAARFEELMK